MKNNIKYSLIVLCFVCSLNLIAEDGSETKYKTVQIGDEIKMVCNNLNDIAKVQWFKNGVMLKDESGDKLIFKNALLGHEGTYWAVVDGVCGITKTNEMVVQVEIPLQRGVETAVAGGDFLFQNEPNPAREIIKIKFNLSASGDVKLLLSNSYGVQVAILHEGYLNQGFHTFELNTNEKNLSSGAYFYTLVTQGFMDTKSLILLK